MSSLRYPTNNMNLDQLKTRLAAINQLPVLRFIDQLDIPGRNRLIGQLSALNLDALPDLVSNYVTGRYTPPIPAEIKPITPLPRQPQSAEHKALYIKALARGHELLRQGKVGAFLVAGGQGTRLGYDGPKGEYPVTPIRNKPLFQVFAQQLLAHCREHGKTIPWYIMTSDINDAPTRAFFARHNHFGYDPSAIYFFQQGMMPAFAMDGQLLLAAKDSLALSPDGHGGSLRAIQRSGALDDMKQRGVEHISYFQVDNPIVYCIDPLYLGLHDLSGSEMSSKTIAKSSPLERVGNFCLADGKLQVIEYSDLPNELAYQTNPDGSLKFNAGSIAIHAMRVSFIERINSGGELQLPWHCAQKKVSCIDRAGNLVKPDKPNAIKLEQFVFDAIPLAANPLVYTTERSEDFSPVKNAEGADSPATSRRDQIRRHAAWLEACGVKIPRDAQGEVLATIEISPLYAATLDQFKMRKPALAEIKPGDVLYLE